MITIPFRTPRLHPVFRVPDRIVLPRFTRDVEELRTWNMDIRQILADNAILDRDKIEQAQLRSVEPTPQGVRVEVDVPMAIDAIDLHLEI